uniref:GT23 domain-containing protein n=1 Tax=Ciona intestinalis TaxID=7719 RepID=H2XYH4_CIOIN
QNPSNCSNAPILLTPYLPCGFGCYVHSIEWVMSLSLFLNKVIVVDQSTSHYTKNVTNDPFQPMSTCQSQNYSRELFSEMNCELEECKFIKSTKQNITCTKFVLVNKELVPRPPGLKPRYLSQQFWNRLYSFHGNPKAWIAGHHIRYILRPKPFMEDIIQQAEKTVNFSQPLVGIHIRRTDKLTMEGENARFITLQQYLPHVDQWYDKYDLSQRRKNITIPTERRIYLATDDPSVWEETKELVGYTFVGFKRFSQAASNLSSRNSLSGLLGVVVDVTMLSKCDAMVCSLSSEVPNLAFELRQTEHLDASNDVIPLDLGYGYEFLVSRVHIAVYAHKAKVKATNETFDEIELMQGDILFTITNWWNGFYNGINERTGEKGLYPTYKVEVYYNFNFEKFVRTRIFTLS